MPLVVIDLAFAVLIVTAGLVAGWWLGWCRASRSSGENAEGTRKARGVLDALHELVVSVASDVGEHASRVQEITKELTATKVHEPEIVTTALAKLVLANSEMQQKLAASEERLQQQAREIEAHAAQARTDSLTELANRRALDDETARRFAEFRSHGRIFSVVLIDVDRFKDLNDRYGHQVGDDVLCNIAERLRQNARAMDLVARYGGDEFAVVFPGTLIADARIGAERLRKAIDEDRFRFGEYDLRVTVSVGVAQLLSDETVLMLMRRSDAAVYASKYAGRNSTHWHDGQASRPFGGKEEPPPSEPDVEEPVAERPEMVIEAPQPPPRQSEAPPSEVDEIGEVDEAAEVQPEPEPAPPPTEAESPAVAEPPKNRPPNLCNRTAFCVSLGRRLAEWRRGGAAPSILLIQIDDLEATMASHGQQVGQLLPDAVAQFVGAAVREMDVAAHYQPATFALLLPGVGLTNAIRVAERLRKAVARCALPLSDGLLQFTVSVGVAEAQDDDDTPGFLRRAEESLDAATRSGGNCTHFHDGRWAESGTALLHEPG